MQNYTQLGKLLQHLMVHSKYVNRNITDHHRQLKELVRKDLNECLRKSTESEHARVQLKPSSISCPDFYILSSDRDLLQHFSAFLHQLQLFHRETVEIMLNLVRAIYFYCMKINDRVARAVLCKALDEQNFLQMLVITKRNTMTLSDSPNLADLTLAKQLIDDLKDIVYLSTDVIHAFQSGAEAIREEIFTKELTAQGNRETLLLEPLETMDHLRTSTKRFNPFETDLTLPPHRPDARRFVSKLSPLLSYHHGDPALATYWTSQRISNLEQRIALQEKDIRNMRQRLTSPWRPSVARNFEWVKYLFEEKTRCLWELRERLDSAKLQKAILHSRSRRGDI